MVMQLIAIVAGAFVLATAGWLQQCLPPVGMTRLMPSRPEADLLARSRFLLAGPAGALIGYLLGLSPLLGLICGPLGLLGLERIIRQRAREARTAALLAGFPSMVDLTVITALAGLNLYQGLELVAGMTRGPMGEELSQTVSEVKGGVPLEGALQRLAHRCHQPAIDTFAGDLIRALHLGTPVVEALAEAATTAREFQRRRLEQWAGRLPVKMTVAAILFFMPAIFAVVVLPNVLSFISRW